MSKLRELARRSIAVVCLGVLMGAAACQSVYRDHGYVPDDFLLQEVTIGESREEVARLIGYPQTTGVLTDSAWYYVQSRWRHFGARAPEPIDRQVVAIDFTPDGRVSNIGRYTLEDGRVIILSRWVTESNIAGVSIITQLLSSVGTMRADQMLTDE
jgi:outer membrane protein assembly factor BamE (lipoprotein component of BamABCDE complex)